MPRGIDFLRLYREFHLEPGAGIDELKQAYRRRVSLVHPDRLSAKDPISQHLANEQLQTLTTLYEAGVKFHRQHGRLPGAFAVPTADRRHLDRRVEDRVQTELSSAVPPRQRSYHWILVALLATGLGFWFWLTKSQGIDTTAATAAPQAAPDTVRASAVARSPDGIQVGMPERIVLVIQGAPVTKELDRWLYGPSWIRFDDGKVVDWYSSSLHPLRISKKPGDWVDH